MKKFFAATIFILALIIVSTANVNANTLTLDNNYKIQNLYWKPARNTQEIPNIGFVVNCREWISLRDEPYTSSRVLARIPLGSRVSVWATNQNGFYAVEYNDIIGFALVDYIRVTDEMDD